MNFKSLPAPIQAQELSTMPSAQLDNLIEGALAERDLETLAILIPCRRNRYEQGEKLYVILKCRDWWLEKNLELWKVHDQYESFAEYVRDKSQEAYSTVLNYCAIWEFYHKKLNWPIEQMALAGMKKLEVTLAVAKRVLTDGVLDTDLEGLLINEEVSYRDLLGNYRLAKDDALWGGQSRTASESGFQFRLYSGEHIERHKRGILEVVQYINGQAIIMPLGRFMIDNSDVAHYVYIIADKIGAEIL